MRTDAEISQDGQHRWTLTRIWDDTLPILVVIGLNPSTADAEADDRTSARLIAFCKSWGFGGYVLVNVFAYRSTDRSVLKTLDRDTAVGAENDKWIEAVINDRGPNPTVLCAWGTDGDLHGGRCNEVLEMLQEMGVEPTALELTKDGFPKHPLYCKGTLRPRTFGTLRTLSASAKEIYLEPWCQDCRANSDADRTWCEDDVYDACPECGAESIRYIREDVV